MTNPKEYKIGQRVRVRFNSIDTQGVIVGASDLTGHQGLYQGIYYLVKQDQKVAFHEYTGNGKGEYLSCHQSVIAWPAIHIYPIQESVELNDEYTAVITKDSIQVGCQSFPLEVLDKLLEARNKVKKNTLLE